MSIPGLSFASIPATVYKYAAIAGLFLASLVGAFFYGVHMEGQKAAAEKAQLIAKYETEESDLLGLQTITNERIVTQIVTKTVTIHDQANNIISVIPDVVDKYPLSLGWVSVYNAGATGSEVDATSAANGTSSGITAAGALPTITNNDTQCRIDQAKLAALQQWINEYNANVDKVNAANKAKGK